MSGGGGDDEGGGGSGGSGGAESEYAESLRYDPEEKHGVTGERIDGISEGDGVLRGGENGAGRNREDDERCSTGPPPAAAAGGAAAASDALDLEKGSTVCMDGCRSSSGDGAVEEGGGDQMEL